MFQPFHRGAEGRAYAKGIGLGLAISKSLVEKMGGGITIKSELGKGSTFSFTVTFPVAPSSSLLLEEDKRYSSFDASIPIAPANMMASSLPGSQGPMRAFELESPLRFLVVDDNALNKSLFERTVDHMFHQQKRAKPVYTFAGNGPALTPSLLGTLSSD